MSDERDIFQWTTLRHLRANPPPEVHFLWGSAANGLMQERSFVMVHASEKMGKSMFTLNLAVAGARADETFLGIGLRPGGFKTLIVQCEVHMRAIYERFESMLSNGAITDEQADRICINAQRTVSLSDKDHLAAFREKIREFSPDLVVVDPLAHLLTEDENSNNAVGRGLAPLLKLRDNPGCAVLVVHHDAKVGDANASRPSHQRSRGANRLTADPDSIWSLSRTRKTGAPTAKFECTARYGRQMEPFRIRMDNESFWFAPYTKDHEYADDILAVIQESNGDPDEALLIARLRDVWNLHDEKHNDRTLRGRLDSAVAEGRVRRYTVGSITVYTIPQEEA